MAPTAKGARVNLRLRVSDDELIRTAAAQTGQSVTDFLTASAVERAREVLADQRDFVVDEETWDQLLEILDRPARPSPRMVELLAQPSRITR